MSEVPTGAIQQLCSSLVLSEDKARLTICTHEGSYELSTQEVLRLIVAFADLRAEMSPGVSENPSQDLVNMAGDKYEVKTDPQTGIVDLALRIPGFGWAYVLLDPQTAARLAETLCPPQAAPPQSPMH